MVKEGHTQAGLVPRLFSGVSNSHERTGVEMKRVPKATSAADRRLSRLLWLAVATLVIGIPAFGFVYYQDQYVDQGGPSLVDRNVVAAEKAVRTAPGNIGARLALAAVYRSANRNDSALTQYDETLKADATNRTALLGRGDVLVIKGDLTQASTSYQKVVGKESKGEFARNDPQLAQAYSSLGQISVKQKRAKDAVKQLESAVKIDPGDADAWYFLGTANMLNGTPNRAIEAFRTAIKFVPTGWCEPYTQLQAAHTKVGAKPQAEYAGAMVDYCQKRPADAKRRLQTLTSGPVAIESMLGLGLIAEEASDRKGATDWYKKVLLKDAKNFNARTGLTRLGAVGTG
jgi:cytochrome c-type biogenesis protein CcmH/NrfG